MKSNQSQATRKESARLVRSMARGIGNALMKVECGKCSERVQFRGPLGENGYRKIFNLEKILFLLIG